MKISRFVMAVLVMVLTMSFTMSAMAEERFNNGKMDRNGLLGEDGRSWRQGWSNILVGEGPTSDEFETYVGFNEPTADNVILFPNASGIVTLSNNPGFTGTGSDGDLYIYNAADAVFRAQEMSADATITNSGAVTVGAINGADLGDTTSSNAYLLIGDTNSWQSEALSGDVSLLNTGASTVGAINGSDLGDTTPTSAYFLIGFGNSWESEAITGDVAVLNTGASTVAAINGNSLGDTSPTTANMLLGNGSEWGSETMSGDGTLSNTGVLTIGANKIGTGELNYEEITVFVVNGSVFGNAAATAGSIITGYRPIANIAMAKMANSVIMNGSSVQIFIGAVNWNTYQEWVVTVVKP